MPSTASAIETFSSPTPIAAAMKAISASSGMPRPAVPNAIASASNLCLWPK